MFFGDDTIPPGIDLRSHIFGWSGLPAEAYLPGPGNVATFGADAPLPLPNLRDPAAIRAWAAELWRQTAIAAGSANQPAAQAAWLRLQRVPLARTAQGMLADVITAGPAPSMPGARAFYGVLSQAQIHAKALTGEPSIRATAGALAAEISRQVAQKSAALAKAVQTAAAKLSSSGSGATAQARAVADHAIREANARQAEAIAAARDVATLPGEVARQTINAAGQAVADVASVPKHLADQAASTAKETVTQLAQTVQAAVPELQQTIREAVPEMQQTLRDLNPRGAFEDIARGMTLGVVTIGGIGALGLGLAYAGPDIVKAVSSRRR